MKKLVILMVLLGLLSACVPANQTEAPVVLTVETQAEAVSAAEAPAGQALAEDAQDIEAGDSESADTQGEQALIEEAQDPESEVSEAATTPTDTPQAVQEAEPQADSDSQAQSENPAEDSQPSSVPVGASGPDVFPPGVNPLTGLPVEDPELLALPPALVSVTNFPVSSRPQAGLSFAPLVFELYIGEGMTRFLALFYGDYPSLNLQDSGNTSVTTDNQPEIGPVRSGRLPYQAIRRLYNGFLVMASASYQVREATTDYTNIYGSDADDISSALIDVTHLRSLAETNWDGLADNRTGNAFDPQPPSGGQEAQSLWMFYNYYNQVRWEYDPESSEYLRSQDRADGSGEFYPATDRLTGEQMGSDNVIVLFVKHDVLNGDRTLIDIDLFYTRGQAYLLRNGQLYPIVWTTLGGDYEKSSGSFRPIRFIDSNGDPIPLKPGNTWVEVVDVSTDFYQVDPGSWKARFYSP